MLVSVAEKKAAKRARHVRPPPVLVLPEDDSLARVRAAVAERKAQRRPRSPPRGSADGSALAEQAAAVRQQRSQDRRDAIRLRLRTIEQLRVTQEVARLRVQNAGLRGQVLRERVLLVQSRREGDALRDAAALRNQVAQAARDQDVSRCLQARAARGPEEAKTRERIFRASRETLSEYYKIWQYFAPSSQNGNDRAPRGAAAELEDA